MGKTHARTKAQTGLILDTGALIALDRGEKRTIALLDEALKRGVPIRVPSGVLAQVWRDGRRQVTLARFLEKEEVEIVPLDEEHARWCGELCRATKTADVIDASVAVLGSLLKNPIITSDPKDLLRLDPSAEIIAIS